MKNLLLGIVLAISAVLPAAASEWVYVSTNENDTVLSVDAESIRQINGGYAYKELLVNEKQNKYIVSYSQMLCRQRTDRSIGYESYTADGQLIGSRQFPDSEFDLISVGSMKATLWQKLCN